MSDDKEWQAHVERCKRITDRDIEENELRRSIENRPRHLTLEEQRLFRDAFRLSATGVRQVLPLRRDTPSPPSNLASMNH